MNATLRGLKLDTEGLCLGPYRTVGMVLWLTSFSVSSAIRLVFDELTFCVLRGEMRGDMFLNNLFRGPIFYFIAYSQVEKNCCGLYGEYYGFYLIA